MLWGAGWGRVGGGGGFFLQAEDGIRDLVRSRGLGDVYKRQIQACGRWTAVRRTSSMATAWKKGCDQRGNRSSASGPVKRALGSVASSGFIFPCLFYQSDAADQRSRVVPGGSPFI